MRVNELMQPEVWQTDPQETLADPPHEIRTPGYPRRSEEGGAPRFHGDHGDAAQRTRDHEMGSLAVIDGEDLIGILTERDLRWAMADGAAPNVTMVSTYRSSSPVVVAPETDVVEAGRLMVKWDVRHLPVVAVRQLRGMISARDLLVAEAWAPELDSAHSR